MREDSFDLVEHPLGVNARDTSTLEKRSDKYTMRLSNKLSTKKISALRATTEFWYVHIEMEDGIVQVVGATVDVYIFGTPVDFYVPVAQDTGERCEQIYKNTMGDSVAEIYTCAEQFWRTFHTTETYFGFCPIPVTTQIGLTTDRSFKDFCGKEKKKGDAIVVKSGGKIPVKPKESALKAVEDFIDASFNPLDFLREVFARSPVLRMNCIKKMYEEEVSEEYKRRVKFNRFRFFVPAVAYYLNSGPWCKTWVRFGVDPAQDKGMYRYQVLSFDKSLDSGFQMFENPRILSEVEKNPDAFLTSEYTPRNGFLTQYGLMLIKKMLRGHEVSDAEDNAGDFEVFD